jgi:hypothetical protein
VTPRLFHASDDPAVTRFEPRPPPSPDAGVTGPAVWAVAETHLPNYLLPRDCPRIGFRAGPATTPADRARFLGAADHVVALEAHWLDRVKGATLALYEMPREPFTAALPEAGYWISREAVAPLSVRRIDDLLAALAQAKAEVRVVADFWALRDAVAGSSLQFSIIRARTARPRGG